MSDAGYLHELKTIKQVNSIYPYVQISVHRRLFVSGVKTALDIVIVVFIAVTAEV